MRKKYLIVIRGPICAGKSSVVKELKKILPDSSHVAADALKRSIDWRKATKWRSQLAFKTACFLTTELMKLERNIITDIHASKINEYEYYQQLADTNGYQFFSFLINAPLEICLARNKSRDIPDVDYMISDQEITDYWQAAVNIENEPSFNSSKSSAAEIAAQIMAKIGIKYK